MGKGYELKCKKCKKKYTIEYGIGFMFPQDYQELIDKIREGLYGQEWKNIYLSNKNVAIDAEKYAYLCRKCGHWSIEPGLSLYVPKDEKHEKDSYVLSCDLKTDYHIFKRRIHKCERCKGVMHKATEGELLRLQCPYCGGEPEDGANSFKWD